MSNFLLASKLRVRFLTSQGELSIEQLWQLSITKLAELIRTLKKEIKVDKDDDLSFLDEISSKKVDTMAELRFNLAKEIYIVRMEEANAAKKLKDDKEHNAKIIELIRNKQDQALNEKSIEDLEKMLR